MAQDVSDRWVAVDGLDVHYLQAGDKGSPVLLLHGGGTDSAALSYKYVIGPLAQGHRVYAPDWPGYGQSDKPDADYSVDYYVRFLGRLMDALALPRASLVGLSLGGGIALGFTLRSPQRVDRLVLVDSYGLGWQAPWPALSYLMIRLPFVNELTWLAFAGSRWLVRQGLRGIMYNPAAVDDELVDEAHALVRQEGVGRAWRTFQRSEVAWGGLATSYVKRLHEVAVPTLIVHGAEDRLVPPAWARRAYALIPDSRLCLLPQCGHWPPREKPEEFNRCLVPFLEDKQTKTPRTRRWKKGES